MRRTALLLTLALAIGPLLAPTATGQTATGQTATGQTATGQTATGQTATGQTATGQTATGQTATGQTATGPTSARRAVTTHRAEVWTSRSLALTVQDPAIDEASGLTRSTWPRRRIWVHNDSGDGHRVFAVGRRGRSIGVLRLRGAPARDWEDIAAGPHHTLWVGDTGDNSRSRSTIQVIRFREPRRVTSRAVRSRTFTLAYPDGPWDAEALMVDPQTARVYVVTKSETGAGIYRAPDPLVAGRTNLLQRVGSAPAVVTGADFAPGGTTFVLRTYTAAYLYSRLGARPTVIDLPAQRQGESIGFTRSGRALLVGSEGVRQPVWRLR